MASRAETGGPREAAHRILLRVDVEGAWASVLLEQAEAAITDPRDRALLHELVLGVLRRRAVLDRAVSAVSDRPPERIDPPVLAALRIGCYGLLFLDRVPDFAAVHTAVALTRRAGVASAAGFVNAVLRGVSRKRGELDPASAASDEPVNLAMTHSHPDWWVERVLQREGPLGATALLTANNQPACTVLRPNPARIRPDELISSLDRDGIEAVGGCWEPEAVRLVSGSPAASRALRDGLAWAQDEASQLVARLVGNRTSGDGVILDACAAPGAKTALLAATVRGGGWILAADRHRRRLRRLSRQIRRCGLEARVATVCADMSRDTGPFSRRFDAVLLDAPCSGTGTLRRHPEIRWRLQPGDIVDLARRQRLLLDANASRVAPGGCLVYSVCSLEPEEGPEQIQRFLADHPSFRSSDPLEWLPAAAHGLIDADGSVRTSPRLGDIDGFFAARLVRAENP